MAKPNLGALDPPWFRPLYIDGRRIGAGEDDNMSSESRCGGGSCTEERLSGRGCGGVDGTSLSSATLGIWPSWRTSFEILVPVLEMPRVLSAVRGWVPVVSRVRDSYVTGGQATAESFPALIDFEGKHRSRGSSGGTRLHGNGAQGARKCWRQ